MLLASGRLPPRNSAQRRNLMVGSMKAPRICPTWSTSKVPASADPTYLTGAADMPGGAKGDPRSVPLIDEATIQADAASRRVRSVSDH